MNVFLIFKKDKRFRDGKAFVIYHITPANDFLRFTSNRKGATLFVSSSDKLKIFSDTFLKKNPKKYFQHTVRSVFNG